MDMKVYAFYRTEHSVVLETGERIPHKNWPARAMQIFTSGDDVMQLHLDTDFYVIKKLFFCPSYWEGKTWKDEYNR